MTSHTEATFTVSEAGGLLGVPVPTIRSWERRYGFPKPMRTSGAHRRYTVQEIDQLRALRDEIATGLSASEAVEILRERLADDRERERVRALLEAGLRYDRTAIRVQLDRAERERGIDHTIEAVIMPVMRDVGTMWQAGRCDVAQEHVASQEVRGWLAARVASPHGTPTGTVVLACGPRDLHTVGLEAFFVMLLRRGLAPTLLGAQTPTESLQTAVTQIKPAAVVVSSHLATNRAAAVSSLVATAGKVPHLFFAGNAFTQARARRGVPGTYLGRDLTSAADLVAGAVGAASTTTG